MGHCFLGPNLKPKSCSFSGLHWGVKGPTGASAILVPQGGAELIPRGGFSLKCLPHVSGRLSQSCPCTSKICAVQNRERPAQSWGWRRRRPSTRDQELAMGDVPLTRLAFALSAAFEPAAPSAAAGVGGMENAVCHNGEKQQCSNNNKDMNQLVASNMTIVFKENLRWRSRNSNSGIGVKCSHRDATEVRGGKTQAWRVIEIKYGR